MDNKLLIIGSGIKTCNVGSMMLRASENMKIVAHLYENNVLFYAPSMQTIQGKIFFKIAMIV